MARIGPVVRAAIEKAESLTAGYIGKRHLLAAIAGAPPLPLAAAPAAPAPAHC